MHLRFASELEGFDMRPGTLDGPCLDTSVFIPPAIGGPTSGAWRLGGHQVEILPDDVQPLALDDFDALNRLYAAPPSTPLIPFLPAANAFFIRRLPYRVRGGRIPRNGGLVRRPLYHSGTSTEYATAAAPSVFRHRLLRAVAFGGWGRRAGAECAPAPA